MKIEIVKPDSIPGDLLSASVDIAKQNGVKDYDSSSAAIKSSSWKEIPIVNDKSEAKSEQPQPQPITDVKEANSFTIAPHIHSYCNALTEKELYHEVSIPDVCPGDHLPDGVDFSMATGEFLAVY